MKMCFTFIVIAILILSNSGISYAQGNDTDYINDTFNRTGKLDEKRLIDDLKDIDVGKYLNGAIGFAFAIASWTNGLIYTVAIGGGSDEKFAEYSAFIATIVIFAIIIASMALGFAKIMKRSFKWIIVIILVIFAMSLIYGFVVA